MANSFEKNFTPSSPEGAPSLRAVQPFTDKECKAFYQENGRYPNVGEAMDKAGGGAGRVELDWVLANPEEARKMLKGDNYFFFPEAAVGDSVPFVLWDGDGFDRDWFHRDYRWYGHDRVVQVG